MQRNVVKSGCDISRYAVHYSNAVLVLAQARGYQKFYSSREYETPFSSTTSSVIRFPCVSNIGILRTFHRHRGCFFTFDRRGLSTSVPVWDAASPSTKSSKKESTANTNTDDTTKIDAPKLYNRRFYLKISAGLFLLVLVIRLSDDGNRRGATFWATTFPAFLHYKGTEKLYKSDFVQKRLRDDSTSTLKTILPPRDEAFQKLHEFYSPRIEQLCYSLRGMYLKNAQFMSLRDDIVPETYLKWCRQLQSMAPTQMEGATAKGIMESELLGKDGIAPGESLDDLFEWIDFENPIGSAAIGVVYKAKMKEHGNSPGKLVAIKVQLPGTEGQFRSDLETLRYFCSFAYPSVITSFDELERQFLSEFDYQLEAANLRKVYDNWRRSGECQSLPDGSKTTAAKYDFLNRVKVPEPFEKLCTKYVLVMEFLEGKSFVRGLEELMEEISRRTGKPVEEMKSELIQRIKEGKLDSIESLRIKLKASDGWETCQKIWKSIVNLLFSRNSTSTSTSRISNLASKSTIPLFDVASFVELLLHFWCYQCLIDGLVQTDPHPGNYLILKSENIGCIDFGQQKLIPYDIRIHFARAIVYLHRSRRLNQWNNRIDSKDAKIQRIKDADLSGFSTDSNTDKSKIMKEIFPPVHNEMVEQLRKLKASDIDVTNTEPELYKIMIEGEESNALRNRILKAYIDEKLNDICVNNLNCKSTRGDGELRLEILRMWMEEDHPKVKFGTSNLDTLVHTWESRDPGHSIDSSIVTVNRAAFMLRSLCRELGLGIILTDVWHLYALDLLEREGVCLETGKKVGKIGNR